jgi:ketosteroid isomerase-like protein
VAAGLSLAAAGPEASDEAGINAFLDGFEKAIAADDHAAVVRCLSKSGYLQVYDYAGGVRVDTIDWWARSHEWLSSNERVKLENRQITVDHNLAYVKLSERSLHQNGSETRYRALYVLVREDGQWRIAVTAGRQL